MEVLSPQLGEKYFWIVIYYISLSVFPSAIFLFIASWMSLPNPTKIRLAVLVSVIPVIAALLMISFPANRSVHDTIWLDYSGIIPVLRKTIGPFYWINQGYLLLFMLGLIISIAYRYRHEQGLARGQANLLIAGLSIPLLAMILLHQGFRLWGVLNPAPFSFLPSILLIWYAVLRYKLVKIQTIARAQVLEQLQDGIMVINRQGILIDINPAAQAFINRPKQILIGKTIENVSSQLAKHLGSKKGNASHEDVLAFLGTPLRVSVTPLVINQGEYDGNVVILHNLTEQFEIERLKEAEAQRQVAWAERQKIARTLHDSIKQYLNSLVILSSTASQRLEQRKYSQLAPVIQHITTSAHRASEEMQEFINELQLAEPSGQDFHLILAIAERINSINILSNLKIVFDSPPEVDLNPAQQREVFYILLEALNNILQHSNASSARLNIKMDGDAFIADIEDNGCGFNSEKPAHEGIGLASMRVRATQLLGHLSITSQPGSGTQIHLVIPGARQRSAIEAAV